MITCFIRCRIDPARKADCVAHARNRGQAIPRRGAELIGCHALNGGSATPVPADPPSRENYAFARKRRFVLREDRTFPTPASGPHAERIIP